jgi:hypothetical protein
MVAATVSSPVVEKFRANVIKRLYKAAPSFQIVPNKAIKLFEYVMAQSADDAAKIDGFWNKAALVRERVLDITANSRRGNMSRLYNEYTAAMFRGMMAADGEDTVLKSADPRAEARAQWHAYQACTASID